MDKTGFVATTVDTKALTTRLVVAFLRGNEVASDDLPRLIQTTYAALTNIAAPQPEPAGQPQPAVTLKKSVTPGAILCLDCGKPQKMLKRHLLTAHGLSVDDYRTKWSLPPTYPMVAPDYAERRSALAKASGLGHSRKKPPGEATAETEGSAGTKPQHRYPASRWSKPAE